MLNRLCLLQLPGGVRLRVPGVCRGFFRLRSSGRDFLVLGLVVPRGGRADGDVYAVGADHVSAKALGFIEGFVCPGNQELEYFSGFHVGHGIVLGNG